MSLPRGRWLLREADGGIGGVSDMDDVRRSLCDELGAARLESDEV